MHLICDAVCGGTHFAVSRKQLKNTEYFSISRCHLQFFRHCLFMLTEFIKKKTFDIYAAF